MARCMINELVVTLDAYLLQLALIIKPCQEFKGIPHILCRFLHLGLGKQLRVLSLQHQGAGGAAGNHRNILPGVFLNYSHIGIGMISCLIQIAAHHQRRTAANEAVIHENLIATLVHDLDEGNPHLRVIGINIAAREEQNLLVRGRLLYLLEHIAEVSGSIARCLPRCHAHYPHHAGGLADGHAQVGKLLAKRNAVQHICHLETMAQHLILRLVSLRMSLQVLCPLQHVQRGYRNAIRAGNIAVLAVGAQHQGVFIVAWIGEMHTAMSRSYKLRPLVFRIGSSNRACRNTGCAGNTVIC